MFKSFAALQKHLDVGKHMVKLAKESAYDEIKQAKMDGGVSFRKWWLRSWSDISQQF